MSKIKVLVPQDVDILNCPFCNCDNIELYPPDGMFVAVKEWNMICMNCKAHGPKMKSRHDAVDMWNSRDAYKAHRSQ